MSLAWLVKWLVVCRMVNGRQVLFSIMPLAGRCPWGMSRALSSELQGQCMQWPASPCPAGGRFLVNRAAGEIRLRQRYKVTVCVGLPGNSSRDISLKREEYLWWGNPGILCVEDVRCVCGGRIALSWERRGRDGKAGVQWCGGMPCQARQESPQQQHKT